MALILNIETSGEVCSVCLAQNSHVQIIKESSEGRNHAAVLAVLIDQIFAEANIKASQLDAVAISQGPGSYTGLRIGVSTAKGICYAAQKPLIAVSTLQALALGFTKSHPIAGNELLCPMLDARRMEVYSAFFNSKLEMIREVSADIVDNESYTDLLKDKSIHFFGSGAEKCREVLQHANASVYGNFDASAAFMSELSEAAFNKGTFVDVAYFEPFYLKEFVAVISKNKVIQ
jgi:tRNA threonylcarbamoyladenosine biosynthesis protein TsaB